MRCTSINKTSITINRTNPLSIEYLFAMDVYTCDEVIGYGFLTRHELYLSAISKTRNDSTKDSEREQMEERKKRKEGDENEEKPVPGNMTLGGPQFCCVYVHMTLSLTSPTRIAPRKPRTAFVYRSSNSRFRITILLGLALTCRTRKPKSVLILSTHPLNFEKKEQNYKKNS